VPIMLHSASARSDCLGSPEKTAQGPSYGFGGIANGESNFRATC
jgi:hypothetical protein